MVTDAEYVLIESTYGGREHEPGDEATRILAETVRLVADSDGVLLVPSFAIGRTQEVVWELDRLLEPASIPPLPLYLDSPMASKASDVYRRHPDYYDEETRKLLASEASPLDYPHQIIVNDYQASQAIARAPRPYMIVASNGMLTGGRVVGHLRNLIDDPRAVILFVGYQGEGTLGAHLQLGAKTVKLDGQVRTVRCQVRSISGFSAHADESELLDWLANFGRGKAAGRPGIRGGSSWSTATRTRRRPCCRRWRRSASTSRPALAPEGRAELSEVDGPDPTGRRRAAPLVGGRPGPAPAVARRPADDRVPGRTRSAREDPRPSPALPRHVRAGPDLRDHPRAGAAGCRLDRVLGDAGLAGRNGVGDRLLGPARVPGPGRRDAGRWSS